MTSLTIPNKVFIITHRLVDATGADKTLMQLYFYTDEQRVVNTVDDLNKRLEKKGITDERYSYVPITRA